MGTRTITGKRYRVQVQETNAGNEELKVRNSEQATISSRTAGDGGPVPRNVFDFKHYAYRRCMEIIFFKWSSYPRSSRHGSVIAGNGEPKARDRERGLKRERTSPRALTPMNNRTARPSPSFSVGSRREQRRRQKGRPVSAPL